MRLWLTLGLLLTWGAPSRPALAWGDEGHEIIALVAQSFLQPDVRRKVAAMLAADTDSLTAHDIASEATWADKYRDEDVDGARRRTSRWHFVDIEVADPSLDAACFHHPPLLAGTPASRGAARDCIVDKIDQFAAELADPLTDADERLVALKFLLHFVGDVQQPLHASDEDDRGGNQIPVSASGFRAGNLHHFWDTEFVALLGNDPRSVAAGLIGQISGAQARQWARGNASAWAMESFAEGRDDAYGRLPEASRRGTVRLTDAYVEMAVADVRVQLAKAGVRLAFLLNGALGRR